MCRVIEEAKVEFDRKFTNGRFYVLLYPTAKHFLNTVVSELEAAGVACLRYTSMLDRPDDYYFVHKYDRHPNAIAHRLVAERLVSDLNLASERN